MARRVTNCRGVGGYEYRATWMETDGTASTGGIILGIEEVNEAVAYANALQDGTDLGEGGWIALGKLGIVDAGTGWKLKGE